MKKILSFMFFLVFIFSGVSSVSASGFGEYKSEKLWFQIKYPTLYSWEVLDLQVKEEWNKVTLIKDGEYTVEEFLFMILNEYI